MSVPPDDLKSWSKNELVRELRRLRAVMREHAEQAPTAHSGGGVTDVAGDPHASGGALIDARGAVLLDDAEVVLVDTKRDEALAMVLRLAGRLNYSTERADTAYMLNPDGAAAIVTEIRGLVARAAGSDLDHGQRFAREFERLVDERTGAMPA
jgi:hypothetical protein